jgi:hypothetical protein
MIVKVQDPVAGYAYVLDSVNQVAHRATIESGPCGAPVMRTPLVGTHPAPDGYVSVTESLGQQTIFGIAVMGTKTTTTYPAGSRLCNGYIRE